MYKYARCYFIKFREKNENRSIMSVSKERSLIECKGIWKTYVKLAELSTNNTNLSIEQAPVFSR